MFKSSNKFKKCKPSLANEGYFIFEKPGQINHSKSINNEELLWLYSDVNLEKLLKLLTRNGQITAVTSGISQNNSVNEKDTSFEL